MKLDIHIPKIETSENIGGTLFSIGDEAIVFDILRNKMYSNPILAICREITCNARDSHREAKCADKPIQITLPNILDPNYRVKDYGVGISKDRVEKIFVKYAASSKREDSNLTGFFGIGSKSPLSYVDSFGVETIFDKIKYTYACIIDETRIGKLIKMDEQPTDQGNGTEIIIPVKPSDFRAFKEGTEFVTRHFEVLPIIKGDTIVFQKEEKALSGTNWDLTQGKNSYDKAIKLIIDGIEYPLNLDNNSEIKFTNQIYGKVYLYFGIGELSLSASRESVHLDKKTISKINERIEIFETEFKQKLINKINAFPSLWEANIFANSDLKYTTYNYSQMSLSWNNIPLTHTSLYAGTIIATFSRNYAYKLYKQQDSYILFNQKNKVIFNDLNIPYADLNSSYVASLFNDKGIDTVQILCPGPKMTWEDLCKKYHLDKMGIVNLSSINNDIKPVKSRKAMSGARLLIFKFDHKTECFKQSSYDDMEKDKNKKFFTLLQRNYNGTRDIVINSKIIVSSVVSDLIENSSKTSVYGVDNTLPKEKIEEHFSEFTKLSSLVDDILLKNKDTDFSEIKYLNNYYYYFNKDFNEEIKKLKELSKDSPYIKYLEFLNEGKEKYLKNSALLKLYELIKGSLSADSYEFAKKNPDKTYLGNLNSIQKKYPLLKYSGMRISEAIIHYINIVDKKEKKQNGK